MHDSFQKSLIFDMFLVLYCVFTRALHCIHRNSCICAVSQLVAASYSLCTNMEVKVFNRAGRELAVLSLGEEASVFALKREFHRKCEV